ncbi:MAG: methylglutaconyl-CoA hydratase [Cyclobacteriaceae bacterium]|jgi:methylglutaconyl-CoA hydratase
MELVKYVVKNRRADIIMCRPEKRNALNPQLVSDMIEAFQKAKMDDHVKLVVLSGEGSAFSAGADLEYLKSLQSNTKEENELDSSRLKVLYETIYQFPKLIIAQVQGHAIAGGAGLVSVCDFVFCTPETKIGYTEVRIGFVPAIVSYFLIRKIGEARATSMLLSGDLFAAHICLSFGLINAIYEADQIENEVDDFVNKMITLNSGESLRMTKELIKKVQDLPFQEAMDLAAIYNTNARSTADCKRGIQAFLDKVKIEW